MNRFSRVPFLIGMVLMLVVAACAPPPRDPNMVTVVRVVDGDTADVELADGQVERLRLIGIDTPEVVDPRRPVQCFGQEASQHAKVLLNGQTVRLQKDASQDERDRYDRLLAYLWLPDGTNFAERMIREGYAFEYTYRTPYQYQSAFRAAQTEARLAGRGLWAANTCAGARGPADLDDEPATPSPSGEADGALTPAPRVDPSGSDRDCTDFRTQTEAQDFYHAAQQASGQRDTHRLDSDGNGRVCESLP